MRVPSDALFSSLMTVSSNRRLSVVMHRGEAILVEWISISQTEDWMCYRIDIRQGKPVWKPRHLVSDDQLRVHPSSVLVPDTGVQLVKERYMRVELPKELIRLQRIASLSGYSDGLADALGGFCYTRPWTIRTPQFNFESMRLKQIWVSRFLFQVSIYCLCFGITYLQFIRACRCLIPQCVNGLCMFVRKLML